MIYLIVKDAGARSGVFTWSAGEERRLQQLPRLKAFEAVAINWKDLGQ